MWHGDDANGETRVIIGIAKARSGNTGNACFLEKGEGIFARDKLAPVIDSSVVIKEDLGEQVLFGVDVLQLCDEALTMLPKQCSISSRAYQAS